MSLFELFQRFTSNTHNPQLDQSRRKHDQLPKTEYGKGEKLTETEIARDKQITFQRGKELGQLFWAAIEEHYSPSEQQKVKDSLLKAMNYLAIKARIFPDMDYEHIWYTDYYDLIELAKDMGLGDDTLPHWPEESNKSKRYLELIVSDLIQIFLGFSEEALLDEYQYGADIDKWVKYLLKETLKSRQRFARERQKQDEAVRFTPSTEQTQTERCAINQSAYEFGVDLGKRVAEEEYINTLEEAVKFYHEGFISQLKTNIEASLYTCNQTVHEITPGLDFSVESFEAHVRASARVTAYYAVIQLYLRHPSISPEKIVAKLGRKFYASLLGIAQK
jgi:hypothetical protein